MFTENIPISQVAILSDFNQLLREEFASDKQALNEMAYILQDHQLNGDEMTAIENEVLSYIMSSTDDHQDVQESLAIDSVGAFCTIQTSADSTMNNENGSDDSVLAPHNESMLIDNNNNLNGPECRRHESYKLFRSRLQRMSFDCKRNAVKKVSASRRYSQRMKRSSEGKARSGDEPFACTECNRSFRSQVSLKNHERIHTMVGRFLCSICKKQFKYNANLQKHRLCHGMNL